MSLDDDDKRIGRSSVTKSNCLYMGQRGLTSYLWINIIRSNKELGVVTFNLLVIFCSACDISCAG